MKVVIYGATGMVGQAALRASLLDPEVTSVVTVGRAATGQQHAKLREVVLADVADAEPVAAEFADADGVLFCLGVSSVGMDPARYIRITYDLTLSVARTAAAANPGLAFIYVSGAGTDSTEQRSGWAKVKGRTENELLKLPFQGYMFRPGFIRPLHGIGPRSRVYRSVYLLVVPLYPILRRFAPRWVMTTDELGRAMLRVVRDGADKRVLESVDIVALGSG